MRQSTPVIASEMLFISRGNLLGSNGMYKKALLLKLSSTFMRFVLGLDPSIAAPLRGSQWRSFSNNIEKITLAAYYDITSYFKTVSTSNLGLNYAKK